MSPKGKRRPRRKRKNKPQAFWLLHSAQKTGGPAWQGRPFFFQPRAAPPCRTGGQGGGCLPGACEEKGPARRLQALHLPGKAQVRVAGRPPPALCLQQNGIHPGRLRQNKLVGKQPLGRQGKKGAGAFTGRKLHRFAAIDGHAIFAGAKLCAGNGVPPCVQESSSGSWCLAINSAFEMPVTAQNGTSREGSCILRCITSVFIQGLLWAKAACARGRKKVSGRSA